MDTTSSRSRRDVLRGALLGATGLWLADGLGVPAFAAPPAARAAPRAKSVIQIWMWGGPPHLDTFDPKPDAGTEFHGGLSKPIETNVTGVRICELLPTLAKQADKYAILRGMTHRNNGHETAAYMVQTGFPAGERVSHPAAGAIVSRFKGYDGGYRGQIPPYVVFTEPQGRFDEAGFLGSRYRPFATGGDPSATPFAVEGIVTPGITPDQQRERRDLLKKLDAFRRALAGDRSVDAFSAAEDTAYDMILGDGAKAFDAADEKPALRDAYGRTRFGQSCLIARRLAERGVPWITINYPGWDTHKDNFPAMRRMLPDLDKGMGTLISDLADRGLLESTIVWWGGEFGRTPRVQYEAPWNGGRGHWGNAFCHVVAGGGFKGGKVVGASDARGEEVKDRPILPRDLLGTIYGLLGIDPESTIRHPQGDEVKVLPPPEKGVASGGPLKEIL